MKQRFIKAVSRIPHYAKYVLAALIVLSLLPLFPTNATFKYRFNVGQTWLYDDLYAGFDFAIKKTDAELAAEKETLEKTVVPFYEVDIDAIKSRKKQFNKAFEEQLRQNKAQFPDVARNADTYLNYGTYVLEKLLNRGILAMDTFLQRKDRDFVVNVLKGNVVEKQTLENIFTPEKAIEWLSDTLAESRLKDQTFLFTLLEPQLRQPNMAQNAEKTLEHKAYELERLNTTRGMVKNGELIVPKGGVVSQATYQKLISYKEQYEADNASSQKHYLTILGYFIIVGLVLGLYIFYLKYHVSTVFIKLRWVLFLLIWSVLYTYLLYSIQAGGVLNPYMVPLCIAPIVIKNFYSRELAFMTHIVIVLVSGWVTNVGFDFIFLQFLAGFVVVFSGFDTRYWAQFFRGIFLIIVVYFLGYIAVSLTEEARLEHINWTVLTWLALNGFLTLLAYPLIPLLGSVFGFTSDISLAELSDLNHPLLKELSLKAPGTLQHSLQVAHLAEEAAKEIHANDLLIKVAALYHDIGKTLKPLFFIENQSGMTNPHDYVAHTESARIIIEHVTGGVKMAERERLPKVLIDCIRTHHGTTLVEYFYRLHIKDKPENEQDRSLFQYPGPTPRTKEETILMLADSIEATAKSLKSPTNEAIDALVERIVADKMAKNQFETSDLTFGDLEKCKASFKKTLKSMHHVRIEYPSVQPPKPEANAS